MKKIDYQAPEMEVVELKSQVSLLSASDPMGESTGGGAKLVDDDADAD